MILNPAALRLPAAPRLFGWGVALLKWALIALILWLLAGLFWRLASRSETPPPSQGSRDPVVLSGNIIAAQFFGVASQGSGAASSNVAMPGIVLRGVLAGKIKQRPVAIVSVSNGAPNVVREGDELAPGVKLDRVYPNRIEVLAAGVRQTVELSK